VQKRLTLNDKEVRTVVPKLRDVAPRGSGETDKALMTLLQDRQAQKQPRLKESGPKSIGWLLSE